MPDWTKTSRCRVSIRAILVEKRKGLRRRRKYSAARAKVVSLRSHEPQRVMRQRPKRPT